MKSVALVASFVLALSLLVQNTCPHGYAGRTSVVRTCVNCPHEQVHDAMRTAIKAVTMAPTLQKQPSHPPLFFLAFQEKMHAFRPAPVESSPVLLAHRYQDAEPYELLRPPHA